MIETITINAGQRLEFYERGDFFRLMEGTDPLQVTYYYNGQEVAEGDNVREGYAEKFDKGEFDRIAITSATTQQIQFVVRYGNVVAYDKTPEGDVNILNVNGAFTHASVAVSTTSVQLAAANPNRRYLLIQNNDSVVDIWFRLDGATAVYGDGIKLSAGSTYEVQGYAPTGKVTAIGTGAGTPNIKITEG